MGPNRRTMKKDGNCSVWLPRNAGKGKRKKGLEFQNPKKDRAREQNES